LEPGLVYISDYAAIFRFYCAVRIPRRII